MANTDSKIQGLLEINRKFAETWKMPATMEQMRAMAVQSGGGLIICLFPILPSPSDTFHWKSSC